MCTSVAKICSLRIVSFCQRVIVHRQRSFSIPKYITYRLRELESSRALWSVPSLIGTCMSCRPRANILVLAVQIPHTFSVEHFEFHFLGISKFLISSLRGWKWMTGCFSLTDHNWFCQINWFITRAGNWTRDIIAFHWSSFIWRTRLDAQIRLSRSIFGSKWIR